MNEKDAEKIEIELLLEAIYQKHGYDFRNYARSSLIRRLSYIRQKNNLNYISELIPKVLYDKAFANQLLRDISVSVTEMFRDPEFFNELRTKVIPLLKTYPYIKIWHAGCATGEEVYSMAILLKEEGFYDRVQIYATDMNEVSLQVAEEGIYSLESMRKFTGNYYKSGGTGSFADNYYAKYQMAIINQDLKRNIVFTNHNLVTDHVFGEMHLIICRNVLIYFNRELQNKVLHLFNQSLVHHGFLCLGSKESLDCSSLANKYEALSVKWRVFRQQLL
jgi:chemotaxis protein methyltransferase CheR